MSFVAVAIGVAVVGAGLGAAGAAGAFGQAPSVPKGKRITDTAIQSQGRPLTDAEKAELASYQAKLDAAGAVGLTPAQRSKLRPTSAEMVRMKNLQQRQGMLGSMLEQQTNWAAPYEQQQFASMARTAPQMAKLQLDLQKQFGLPMMQASYDAQKAIQPEFYNNRAALGNYLGDQIGKGLNPNQLDFFAQQQRAAQAVRGLADSPLGSTQEARYLTEIDLAQQQKNIANMQNFLNNYQLMNTPQVGVPALPMGGNAGPALTPTSFADTMNLEANLAGMRFAQKQQRYDNLNAGMSQLGGSLMGMGSGMMGGGGGMGGFGGSTFNQQQKPPSYMYQGGNMFSTGY